MSEPYTPSVVNTIRKNAGFMPPQKIADDLGWTATRLKRVAEHHKINLRAVLVDCDDGTVALAIVGRARLPDRRSEHFGVRLRRADAEILRTKAAARFTNPSDLLSRVFEGAIARGKVDELASAAGSYRPGDSVKSASAQG